MTEREKLPNQQKTRTLWEKAKYIFKKYLRSKHHQTIAQSAGAVEYTDGFSAEG